MAKFIATVETPEEAHDTICPGGHWAKSPREKCRILIALRAQREAGRQGARQKWCSEHCAPDLTGVHESGCVFEEAPDGD
jgi:hypothetical protein